MGGGIITKFVGGSVQTQLRPGFIKTSFAPNLGGIQAKFNPGFVKSSFQGGFINSIWSNLIVNTVAPYEAEYTAILTQAIALGYTLPSLEQQIKQNAFLKALKTAGIWALLDVFYVFASDGDSNFATLNWKTPTQFQVTKTNAPAFIASQGFQGNGVNARLNTNWIPSINSVNYTQNNCSIFSNVLNEGQDNGVEWGGAASGNTTPRNDFLSRSTTDQAEYMSNATNNQQFVANVTAIGFYHVQRIISTNNKLYKNGLLLSTSGGVPSTGLPSFSQAILCQNIGGTFLNFSSRLISVFGAGASLSGLENTFYTLWNTYLTSLP